MNAIIAGTGIDELFPNSKVYEIETKYGKAHYIIEKDIIIILRHGIDHAIPPHLINYRANVEALRLLEVKKCIGIYAVGSISYKLPPGTVSIISDFIDFTKGKRESTFSTTNNVFHVDMTEPFDLDMIAEIKREADLNGFELREDGVYVCTDGPRLETATEIKMYNQLGADYVGMTGCPEITLMKETGIKYVGLAYSINWACGVNQDKVMFLDSKTKENISKSIVSFCLKFHSQVS